VVGVDSSLDIACSLDMAGSLAGPLDAAGSLAGSLVMADLLEGVGSLLDTEGSIKGDVVGKAAEEVSAKPPEVNAVEQVVSVDCSGP